MEDLKRTPVYLEQRIRELEAELATERQAGQIELGQRIAWRIRAEKAETDAHESLGLVRFLEARVRELEARAEKAERLVREREED